jgi:pseudouridine synthase
LAEIGAVIEETSDIVRVDGSVVTPVTSRLYVLLNKPRNVMTTMHDPFKRRTVVHLLKNVPERVFPVGRLDYSTEGILLLTNDGDLAYRLSHPRYQVPKVYQATVEGCFMPEKGELIAAGIKLDDGVTGHARIDHIQQGPKTSVVRMTLFEGRKREVRQLCKSVGHPVKRLTRIKFAGLTEEGLKKGDWRYLTQAELDRLKRLVGLPVTLC